MVMTIASACVRTSRRMASQPTGHKVVSITAWLARMLATSKQTKEFEGKIKSKKEFGSAAAKVIDTKTKNATYNGWSLREMKNKCCELEDDNADLHNQVYRNVCIVNVCVSKNGVLG